MTIDYLDISLFGFTVLDTNGELSFPKPKRPYSHNWPDASGLDIDLSKSFIEARTINLTVKLEAINSTDYYTKLSLFQEFIQRPGLRVMKYSYFAKPYFVYLDDMVQIDRLTPYISDPVVGKFILKFIEPNPVAKYFYTANPITNVSFTISCSEPCTIHWGDGTKQIVNGSNVNVSKIYNPNLLGTSGSCESFTGWTQGIATLITNDGSLGSTKCFQHSVGSSADFSLYYDMSSFINYNQAYYVSFYGKKVSGSSFITQFQGSINVPSAAVNDTVWTRYGKAFIPVLSTTSKRFYMFANANSVAKFDNVLILPITKAEKALLTSTELANKYAFNDGSASSGAYTNYVAITGNVSKITLISNLTGLTEIV